MEFFAGANTRYGFKSFFEEAFKNTERLYILKGSSGCGKSTLMRRIAGKAQKLKLQTDVIYCSADSDSLDGVIIPSLGIAIADGTAPHLMDVKYPCVRESIVNLGQFWDESKLIPHRAKIIGLTDLKSCHYKNAYRALAAVGNTAELSEELLSRCIDVKKLDTFAFKLSEKLIGKKRGGYTRLFATAFTSEGIKTLPVFDNVKILYRLIGKASQELLTAILRISSELGAESVISLNALDPAKADSIYFPETGALITLLSVPPCKTAKEEHSVSTARFINSTKAASIKNRLKGLEKLQAELADDAKKELAEAKAVHNEIESIYIPAMDFKAMDEYTVSLSKKIFSE